MSLHLLVNLAFSLENSIILFELGELKDRTRAVCTSENVPDDDVRTVIHLA